MGPRAISSALVVGLLLLVAAPVPSGAGEAPASARHLVPTPTRIEIPAPPRLLSLLPDAKTLAASLEDGSLALVEIASGRVASTWSGKATGLDVLAVAPGGQSLLALGKDERLHVFGIPAADEVSSFAVPGPSVSAVIFSPDGKAVAVAGTDNAILIADPATGKAIQTLQAPRGPILSLSFSQEGKFLAAGLAYSGVADADNVLVWELASGKIVRSIPSRSSSVPCLAFIPGRSLLAFQDGDGQVALLDASTGERRRFEREEGLAVGEIFTRLLPVGPSVLAGGTASGSIRLWSVSSGAILYDLPAHKGAVTALAVSADGATLASGGADKVVALWTLPKGDLLLTLGRPLGEWLKDLKEGDPAARLTALDALRRIGSSAKTAVPLLTKALGDASPDIRKAACRAVGAMGNDAAPAIPALVKLFEEVGIGDEAAKAVARVGDPAVPALRDALHDKELAQVRRTAALAAMAFEPLPEPLVPALVESAGDPDLTVRTLALQALPRRADTAPAFVAALADDDPSFRTLATVALGETKEKAIPAILALLDAQDPKSRTSLLRALEIVVEAAPEASVDLLGNALAHKSLEIRVAVPSILSKIQTPGEAQEKTLEVLFGKKTPDVVSLLGRALAKDPAADVRAAAAEALLRFGEAVEVALPALLDRIENDDKWQVKARSIQALGILGTKAKPATPLLVRAMADGNLKTSAAVVLKSLGNEALPEIVKALQADDPEIEAGAVYALLAVTTKATLETALPHFVAALRDEEDLVRMAASTSLLAFDLRPHAKEIVPVMGKALHDRNWRIAEDAAKALTKLGPDALPAAKELVEALGGAPTVSDQAFEGLLAIGKDALPAVERGLKATPDAAKGGKENGLEMNRVLGIHVRSMRLIRKFLTLKEPGTLNLATLLPDLRSELKTEEPILRIEGARTLGSFGPEAKAAIPDLIPLLNDKEELVRRAAASGLGRMGEAAVEPVVKIFREGKEVSARLAAVWALGEAGKALGDAGKTEEKVLPHVFEALEDKENAIRVAALQAFGRMGKTPEAAFIPVFEVLQDGTQEVISAALGALVQADKAALVPARKCLEDPALRVAGLRAYTALGQRLEADKVVPTIIRYVGDPSADVRAEVFAQILPIALVGKEGEIMPILTKALGDGDPRVREHAAQILGRFPKEAVPLVPALARLLKDDVSGPRKAALETLAAIGDPAKVAVPDAIPCLTHDDEAVRAAASAFLKKFSKEAFPGVLPLLQDKDAETRLRAVQAIPGLTPGDRAGDLVLALIPLLKDPEKTVRSAAATALGGMGSAAKAAVPALVQTLQDGELDVKIDAVKALERLGPEAGEAIPAIKALADDADDKNPLKEAAKKALEKIDPPPPIRPRSSGSKGPGGEQTGRKGRWRGHPGAEL